MENQAGGASGNLVAVEGLPLALGALKRAEKGDGLLLRLYEPRGARGLATLRFTLPVQRIERVTLLEEQTSGSGLAVEDGGATVRIEVRPFEVISLRVVFSN
jgi:alpha-mannosidase